MKAARLTIAGDGSDEIPTGVLTGPMAAAEAEEMGVTGVSIDWRQSNGASEDGREE